MLRRLRRYACSATLMLTVGTVSGCDLNTGPEDNRLFFRNAGPCELIFRFGGGIAVGTQGIDHRPKINVWNSVPLEAPGTITVLLGAMPAGAVSCGFDMEVDSNSRYSWEHGASWDYNGKGGTGQGYGFGDALSPNYAPKTYKLIRD